MKRSTPSFYRIAFIAALGGFVFGFDASVISGVIGFVTQEFSLNIWQQGMVVSAPTLSAIFASLFVVPMADKVGRKTMLLIVSFLYLISAISSALAFDFWSLVLARALGGLAFASLMITPIYIAEMVPAKSRGSMVSINQMNIVIGLSAAYFANFILLKLSQQDASWVKALGFDHHTWRWMLGLETLPALCWFLALFSISESPRWLAVKGKTELARKNFLRLFSEDETEQALSEISCLNKSTSRSLLSSFKELTSPSMRKVMLLGALVGIIQQITGINAVFFFATSIFERCGIGQDAAFVQAVWVGLINVVFTLAAVFLMDRWGRKPLLIVGLSMVLLSMSITAYGFHKASYVLEESDLTTLPSEIESSKLSPIIGLYFESDVAFRKEVSELIGYETYQKHQGALTQVATQMNPYIVLVGILGFVAAFAISLGPVMWVLLSEIFPNHLRGVAIAAIGIINSTTSFLVQFLFPWELQTLGNALTFALYAIFAVIGLALVIRFLPETKNRSLEAIQKELIQ